MGTAKGFAKELSGGWKAAWDRENDGKRTGWADGIRPEAVDAIFPGYICDSIPGFHRGVAWYWDRFTLEEAPDPEQEYFLLLGYTEYLAEYWVNGRYIGSFEGIRLNYEFEIGSALRAGENLLAIRLVSPPPEGIDGYYCDRGSTPNYFDDNIVNHAAGKDHAFGGVFYPVRLESRPRLRSRRIVIRPDYETGAVRIRAELANTTGREQPASLRVQIFSPGHGLADEAEVSLLVPAGGAEVSLECAVAEKRLWSLEEPNLYTAVVTLQGETSVHTKTETFGFRDFRVKDGFFYLNGKRMFLKSWNYGLILPDVYKPWSFASCYRDIVNLKAVGFHMFRFLVSNPFPEFIEMCDRLGALIYEEHAASWCMSEQNPRLEEQMEFHMREVVRRDVNHPSVVVFGLSNESLSPRVRRYIRSALPMLRAEDPDRLFMLDSGRWDLDMSVGSVSNPGSHEWDHVWGGERPDGRVLQDTDLVFDGNGGSAPEMGDLHIYPKVPLTPQALRSIRTQGKGFKPCFVSEGGIGAFWEEFKSVRLNEYRRGPGRPAPESMRYVFRRVEYLTRDFKRYHMDDVYPSVTDLSYWSYKANIYQKKIYNMALRSNPQYAGYNSSGLTNPTNRGEETNKPFQVDATMESMSRLMWCVFLEPTNVHAGRPFTVEVVLADEDTLWPGDYPVTARIASPDHGCVWEHRAVLTVPEPPEGGVNPFSYPVFKETVCLDVPEGEYELTVWMESGAIPTNGKHTLYVTRVEPLASREARMIGLPEEARAWLGEHGVREVPESGTVLVGDMPDDDGAWEELWERVRAGARAVFLKPETFLRSVRDPFDHGDYVPERLPFENKGYLTYAESWYYHPINVLRDHPFFRGLPKGVMDDGYWQLATPQFVFHRQDVPDEVAAVTVAAPYFTGVDELIGYLCGTALGTYRYGAGSFTLSCFKILDTLGTNPAADRLLLNLVEASGPDGKD